MNFVDSQNDFNLEALWVGCLILLVCLMVQVGIIHYTSMTIRFLRRHWLKPTPSRAAKVDFLVGAIVLLLIHLLHIYIWGYSIYFAGLVNALNKAVIFAGSTYTTVGFAAVPLKPSWEMLTIIMATSGLFSFGLSTSVMFILGQKAYATYNHGVK